MAVYSLLMNYLLHRHRKFVCVCVCVWGGGGGGGGTKQANSQISSVLFS